MARSSISPFSGYRLAIALLGLQAVAAMPPSILQMAPNGPLFQAEEPLRRVRIICSDPAGMAQSLDQEGFDVLFNTVKGSSFELIVGPASEAILEARGLRLQLLEMGRPFEEIQREQELIRAVPVGYKDLDAILQDMRDVEMAHPGLAMVVDLTTTFGAPVTAEGRHIYGLKISDNVGSDEDEPNVQIVAAHHVRELVTPIIAMNAVAELTSKYATDSRVKQVVDGNEIWVIPVWNPDGYNHVFKVDNMWRKNRRAFSGGYGVDLNRNYNFGWSLATCGGSTSVTSETYRGPSAASEAETQTMMRFTEQRHFERVLDFHSAGREVLFDYSTCQTHPLKTWLETRGKAFSTNAGYNGAVRPPSASGEHYQWQMARGAHGFLVETAATFQPAIADAQAEAKQLWPAILTFLEAPTPISGKVRDAKSGEVILGAKLEYPSIAYKQGEAFTSGGPFGRYHAFLPTGTYAVKVTAPGYDAKETSVSVTDGKATVQDILLNKTGSVEVPPAITTEPADANVLVGQTATFRVVANGTPVPTYQWMVNGKDIAGATSASYTTPATTMADSGAKYSVTVTNRAGSVTSREALLTITDVPPPPSDVNLALKKPTSASSTYTGRPSSLAVDGVNTTRWSSKTLTATTKTQWLAVDLGTPQSVSRANILWGATYFASAWSVQYLNSSNVWTTVWSTNNATAGRWQEVTFPAVTASQWRIHMTANKLSNYTVYEVQLFSR